MGGISKHHVVQVLIERTSIIAHSLEGVLHHSSTVSTFVHRLLHTVETSTQVVSLPSPQVCVCVCVCVCVSVCEASG